MENKANRKSDKRDITIFLLCVLFCVAGAVTGCFIFSKSYNDADINAFISAHYSVRMSFRDFFRTALAEESMFLVLVLLSGSFFFGWILIPPLLLLGTLGFGISVCCICARSGWSGLLYAAAVVVVPAFCTMLSRSVAGTEAIRSSFYLFSCVAGRRISDRNLLKQLIIKIPFIVVINVFASALSSLMRTIYLDSLI